MNNSEAATEIASPCVRNCCLNDDNICLGCFRSLEEICAWAQADTQTRKQVLAKAGQRRREHAGRSKGVW